MVVNSAGNRKHSTPGALDFQENEGAFPVHLNLDGEGGGGLSQDVLSLEGYDIFALTE